MHVPAGKEHTLHDIHPIELYKYKLIFTSTLTTNKELAVPADIQYVLDNLKLKINFQSTLVRKVFM